ncbi:MAG: TRAP transporter large permease subunit [Desulfatiglandaceae bacterium]|jgi:tripartite ATP-independent transporter DctM subunit
MSPYLKLVIRRLECIVNPMVNTANAIAALLLGFMALPVFFDVLFRLIFSSSIPGAIEIEEILMGIVVFFGIAHTHANGGHISVDLLTSKLNATARIVIENCLYLLSSIFFGLMSWQLVAQGLGKFHNHEVSFTYKIPVGAFRFIAAFGVAILALTVFVSFLKTLEKTVARGKIIWLIPALIVTGLLVAAPLAGWIPMNWYGAPIGIAGMGVLFLFLFLGMPIGFAMGLTGFLGMTVIYQGIGPSLSMLGIASYDTAASYMLTVVPLFILMGEFAYRSGISRDLFDTAYKWFGRLPGGMTMSALAGCAGFSAICGDSLATAVTMGTIAIPEMKKKKYDLRLATGALAAGGTLGILIPPSVGFIFYAIVTEESIGRLFIAGILPGLLLSALFLATTYVIARRNPELAPPGQASTLKEKLVSLKGVIGMLALFVLILGGIFGGVFSPVEGGAIGVVGAFVYALIRRSMTWPLMVEALKGTLSITSKLLLILIGVGILGYFLASTRLPFILAGFVTGLQVNRYVVFAAVIALFMLLGCLLNVIPMILLVLPTIFPAIVALGFDPIWFGVVTVLTMEMGQITPPIGVNVFAISSVADGLPLQEIFRGIVPYFLCMVLCIFLLTLFPQIVLYLPNLLFK